MANCTEIIANFCQLRSQYSENTPKLTDAPSFCHIASLQVGYGGGSKPSKHSYGFRYDIRHITEVPKS